MYVPRYGGTHLEDAAERALAQVAHVDDVVAGVFERLQTGRQQRLVLLVAGVGRQLGQVDSLRFLPADMSTAHCNRPQHRQQNPSTAHCNQP